MDTQRSFGDTLVERVRAARTPCVVGLDPDLASIPPAFLADAGADVSPDASTCAAAVERFSAEVIEAVHDLVPAVKPQSAYFERWGAAGIAALQRTILRARRKGLLVILDAKRGDVGSTAEAYAAAYLARGAPGSLECDALTVSPYLGLDALAPFLDVCERDGKGLFVLVRTSNPGARDLQDGSRAGARVFEAVAELIAPRAAALVGCAGLSAIGAVVGGTAPEHARSVRRLLPHSFFLVPGFGAQGADPVRAREYVRADGLGALFSSSRAVLYPHLGSGAPWSPRAVREAAVAFVRSIRSALGSP